ncbi:macrolide ABC transporter ATP-binding protein [Lysinibacillus xylanilyticus]|uniref:Macrolide ABC transporter ATP-binding protein n=1 Tax=Lysinibacillus xylanilyticus TaxID=582475 RepID=A0A0K9FAY6_9BACI|nr:ABC transporter ATP-binding protein [Lysinibacillus xylanilyticus]KMY31610.1 macrolide ABC transporter ATP-binding protein [Lysinibacillus xylanilyticus]
MTKIIEAIQVCKSFNTGEVKTDVLKNINLEINKGEFVSIMGPSGSGKSTLLYLLGSLDKPTSGKIKVNGNDTSEMSDKAESILRRRDIGFVFQFYNLIPNFTVEENIVLPISLDGKNVKHYKEELDEILNIVGLSEKRGNTPRQLSGGQQQRVAIARALINDPAIILADEPIGNLDSKTGMEVMNLLKRINEEKGKTIVQVTHSKEAAEFGQRLVYVKDGQIDNSLSHSLS